jgi:hypothetical protein
MSNQEMQKLTGELKAYLDLYEQMKDWSKEKNV